MSETYRQFTEEELRDIFSYHPPTPEEREVYEAINAAVIEFALKVVPLLPEGPGRTVAVRSLARARMDCNAAVALKGRF